MNSLINIILKPIPHENTKVKIIKNVETLSCYIYQSNDHKNIITASFLLHWLVEALVPHKTMVLDRLEDSTKQFYIIV